MNDDSEIIEIPPNTSAITAMIDADGMSLKKAVAELTANATDAGATLVELNKCITERDTTFLVFRDNGLGCEDLAKMIQLGNHFNVRKARWCLAGSALVSRMPLSGWGEPSG
jgi:hypothetical protein